MSEQLHIGESRRTRISPIWIVPIMAAVIGALVAWQSYRSQGPMVEIRFSQGHGFQAGRTEIRHKGITVGQVEEVTFTEQLDAVVVRARMAHIFEPYLGENTVFSAITAQLNGTSFSGLGTILSGAYIEVDIPESVGASQRHFVGHDTRPLTSPDVAGQRFSLFTDVAEGINMGTGVYFRNVQVGQVDRRQIAEDFSSIEYDIFIEAPYDSLINDRTQFWKLPALDIDTGGGGVSVEMTSLEILLAGGITFSTPPAGARRPPVSEGRRFRIYGNEDDARDAHYTENAEDGFFFRTNFDTLRGLETGAAIRWQGVRVGTVRDVVIDLDQKEDQIMYAILEIQPGRLGLDNVDADELQARIADWVRRGLRTTLTSESLLSNKKSVQLVEVALAEGETPLELDPDSEPWPTIPSTVSDVTAVTQNVEDIINEIAGLPLDELVASAIRLLDNAGAFVGNPELQGVPGELGNTLRTFSDTAVNLQDASRNLPTLIDNLNRMADAGETTLAGLSPQSEVYVDLSRVMRNLRETSRSLQLLVNRLERNPSSLIYGR
ncbi:MAG: hypothetical protein CSA54_04565 [Gammaproteobacteria bacterium]|nr:MAG: hypothetical protein CSA54_04565 [Gammaproteobacteria bacterium]